MNCYPEGTDNSLAPWNEPEIEEFCEECGEPFDIDDFGLDIPYATDHGNFCSKKCAGEEEY